MQPLSLLRALSISAVIAATLPSAAAAQAAAGTAAAGASIATAGASASGAAAITASASIPGEWVAARYPLRLTLSRALAVDEGRIAVVINNVDISDLLAIDGEAVRYAGRVPLPAGQADVVAYLVTPAAAWQEIGRFPIRVLTPMGYERVETRPVVEVGWKSQMFEGHQPAANAPPRPRFSDLTLNAGVNGRFVRDGVTYTNLATIIGSSFVNEALRFGERGDEAPRIDLSSYQVGVERNRVTGTLGQVSFGSSRHLINTFASRGAMFAAPAGSRATVSVAALNGTNVVGWNNLLGFTRDDHRLVSGTFAVDLLPRAGALRAETTLLRGSVLPQANVNQGAITDAQDSRGLSFRMVAGDAAGRLSIDGGVTRSRFVNPNDPLLAQGTTVVPVRDETRNARYLDASYAVLKDRPLGKTTRATVTVIGRHELVDPLFKSIGATSVQPDLLQNQLEAQAVLGQATVQVAHQRLEDNVDDVASILKTLTRRNTVNAMVPIGSFASPAIAARLPRITYLYDRVLQFGEGIPVNSDFSATHVPQQMSRNQALAIEWALPTWRAAYRVGTSFQDNQQVGRERADLGNRTQLVAVGVSPRPTLDLAAEFGRDRAENFEFTRIDTTRRFAVNGDWRITPAVALQGLFSSTWTGDSTGQVSGRATQLDLQASWQIRLARSPRQKPAVRTFLKFSRLTDRSINGLFGLAPTMREGWTVNTGATLSVF